MRSNSLRHVLVILLFALVASAAVTAPVGAENSVGNTLDIDAAKANSIHGIYQDFLGRRATQDELDRFMPRFGVGQSQSDVRARVLASRAFLVAEGGDRDGFVRGVYRELLDRQPTDGELTRTKRTLFRSPKSLLAARQDFTTAMIKRAEYDPDDVGVREIVLHKNANGEIVRFAFELDTDFAAADRIAASVSIKGVPIAGTTRVRAFENTVSLVPNTPVEELGKIVGLIFVRQDGTTSLADMSTPSKNLPDRTVDEYEWPERVFEDERVVAYYGNHLTPLLGVLGETGPEAAVDRVKRQTALFEADDKGARGAFEMIVTVAQRSAGADGNFSHPSNVNDVRRWVDIAAENGLHVILDIQPGTSDFLTESVRYEELLKLPNVHLALDPEWRMRPGQRPGSAVGQVSAAEVNEVSKWLSDLTLENDLPEKMFIVHQFQLRMITNREDLIDRPGLATVIHADGFGGRAIKQVTYGLIKVDEPFYNGFKLFIDEDTGIYQPHEVIEFSPNPVPDLVTYQ